MALNFSSIVEAFIVPALPHLFYLAISIIFVFKASLSKIIIKKNKKGFKIIIEGEPK